MAQQGYCLTPLTIPLFFGLHNYTLHLQATLTRQLPLLLCVVNTKQSKHGTVQILKV
jgi:hypothetical protein